MNIISLKLAWKWGGAKEVTCADAMTVEEVARDHGFTDVAEAAPLYISRGKVLAPELTLRAHQIADGQKIIAYLPSAARARRPQLLAEPPAVRCRAMCDIEDGEASRQADQDFAHWESARNLPLVMGELLAMIEDEAERSTRIEEVSEVPPMPTVVRASARISEDPLPRLPNLGRGWQRRD
jgi:hypothetical protein